SAATTLRWLRSSDATITAADASEGTEAVGALSASATSAESAKVTAPEKTGTYYYGGCVDSVAGESDTTNNCSAGVKVTVTPAAAPDLVVQSAAVDDATVEAGDEFTLSATVRNSGDAESAATTLRWYRSTDATITSADTASGTDAVGKLSASATSAESIGVTAPDPGTYYYGGCVDSVAGESDTTNNCSAGVKVTVTPAAAPDLVVQSAAVDDATVEAGDEFTLSATVRNSGDAESAATTLRWYRSTDATITSADTASGTDAVGKLSASATSAESIGVTAPDPGTYYYGGCVDSVAGESDTANNCSAGVKVTVTPAAAPDLVVQSAAVDDATVEAGDEFTLSATVRNSGDAESAATTLRWYRSTDATITSADTASGTDAVGKLSASATSAESIGVTAPDPGTYYYGGCVDSVAGESDTTNNCSAGVKVVVSKATAPDLVVVAGINATELEAGATFTLTAGSRNDGDAASTATTVRYYRSSDATITTADTELGDDPVGALDPKSAEVDWIRLTAPTDPGTYYYGACIDAVAGESDTTNNCSASEARSVPEPEPEPESGSPNLQVLYPSTNHTDREVGKPFLLRALVTNTGDDDAPATTLRFYRSADAAITTGDTQEATVSVPALSASSTSSADDSEWGSVNLTAPSTAGTYYYGACVDSVAGESDTSDNCSSGAEMTVTAKVAGTAPDLVVESPNINQPDRKAGAVFTLGATVRNAGDGAADKSTLRYYRSADATITTGDTQEATDEVDALGVSETDILFNVLNAPTSLGTYYYGACVDAVADESDTTNNCSGSVKLTVIPENGAPDLVVVSPAVSDSALKAGDGFTLSATVRNDGDGVPARTSMRWLQSSDATIDNDDDTYVGGSGVTVGVTVNTSSESIDLTAPATPATYYYGGCVVAVARETDTTNNCSAGVKVVVSAADP
ncbi:MAG: hypothetical protein OXH52_10555, partial [Gammaproteobacteria bacterium]|nr:hypothetical protein [Gammaproteobacteria bacterium]